MKRTLGFLLVALSVAVLVGVGSRTENRKQDGQKSTSSPVAGSGTTHDPANDRKSARSRNDSSPLFRHPPEWHIDHWPSGQVIQVHGSLRRDGLHVWKSDQGTVLGEIEFRDGQPFQGIMYTQGASDFRMIQQYENGVIDDHMSFWSNEGNWEVFGVFRDGAVTYSRK